MQTQQCKFGANCLRPDCRFQHNITKFNIPCIHHLNGRCLKGDHCPYQHAPQPKNNSVRKSPETQHQNTAPTQPTGPEVPDIQPREIPSIQAPAKTQSASVEATKPEIASVQTPSTQVPQIEPPKKSAVHEFPAPQPPKLETLQTEAPKLTEVPPIQPPKLKTSNQTTAVQPPQIQPPKQTTPAQAAQVAPPKLSQTTTPDLVKIPEIQAPQKTTPKTKVPQKATKKPEPQKEEQKSEQTITIGSVSLPTSKSSKVQFSVQPKTFEEIMREKQLKKQQQLQQNTKKDVKQKPAPEPKKQQRIVNTEALKRKSETQDPNPKKPKPTPEEPEDLQRICDEMITVQEATHNSPNPFSEETTLEFTKTPSQTALKEDEEPKMPEIKDTRESTSAERVVNLSQRKSSLTKPESRILSLEEIKARKAKKQQEEAKAQSGVLPPEETEAKKKPEEVKPQGRPLEEIEAKKKPEAKLLSAPKVIPAKRQTTSQETPVKKIKAPAVSREEWKPVAEVVNSLDLDNWEGENLTSTEIQERKTIASKLATPEGFTEILEQLQEKVDVLNVQPQPDPEFEKLTLSEQIDFLYQKIVTN